MFGFLENGKHVNTKGIGLGLYISKMISKMYDGDIVCRSLLNKGSIFIFIVALNEVDYSEDKNA